MFIKLGVILFVLQYSSGHEQNHNWDLAVVINDQIELLQSNGTLIGSTVQQFSTLKALTFDNVRHQFVVSDMDQLNDTIFTVQLTKETDITPIIQDLPDDVQGLAIDPITDTLYWTDSINHTINFVSLNDSSRQTQILFAFTDENPQDIAIDVCRRYIYWTNSNFNKPTIERAKLDGTEHTVLVDSDLRIPAGIAIDYKAQRLYFADMREGIYYRIESTNLEGKERQIVYEGTHSKPFGIAVDEFAIYFTDVNNNALWKMEKLDQKSVPTKIRNFSEKPMGLVAKNMQIKTLPDCKIVAQAVEKYNGSTMEFFNEETDEGEYQILECLNYGELIENTCKCGRGYTGRNCEISVCHNFCVHGNCHLSSLGYPRCHCPKGFGGHRCERNMCDEYCLNGGECSYNSQSSSLPKCTCTKHFVGSRCEISASFRNLCELYCRNRDGDYLASTDNELLCRCNEGSYTVSKNNITTARLFVGESEFQYDMEKLKDPLVLFQMALLGICIVIIIVLSTYMCKIRKQRPRIKKRIIVNKNVTPLTYRPQPTTEQCEITIENCCNMNVCETPCFEPPTLRSFQKSDDKKKLLANMENGEDLY